MALPSPTRTDDVVHAPYIPSTGASATILQDNMVQTTGPAGESIAVDGVLSDTFISAPPELIVKATRT
jgi:hypothetical protein